jgi:uridine phosphorylase
MLEKKALDYFVHHAGSPDGVVEGGIAVFAAGNEYAPAASYPAAYPDYVSVAATAGDFTPAVYSNYGKGVTISAPGFYAPQGRWVRLQPQDPELNAKIRTFDYNGEKITNYEMESSAVAGLSRLLGHRAMTVCCIIAGRTSGDMNTEYHGTMEKLVETVLQRLMK